MNDPGQQVLAGRPQFSIHDFSFSVAKRDPQFRNPATGLAPVVQRLLHYFERVCSAPTDAKLRILFLDIA